MSLMRQGSKAAQVIDGATVPGPLNDELARLISEINRDEDVRLMLDNSPEVPQLSTPRQGIEVPRDASRESLPSATGAAEGSGGTAPVIYRDPEDVLTIHRLAWALLFMVMVVIVCLGAVIAMYVRRPDLVVVDRTSGRTLMINDRQYGETESVQLGPDKLTNRDKQYVTREFVKNLYQIDPATRPKDVERALTMMVPDSAVKFARWMKQEGVLDRQRSESWQAVWTPQDVSIDAHDPYTVRVIGKQEITRLVNGVATQESRQLSLTIKLVADGKGRADRNLRSGFLISYIDYRELSQPPQAKASGLPLLDNLARLPGAVDLTSGEYAQK